WSAPPVIWAAIIGESGSTKSPALNMVTHLAMERQEEAFERYSAELALYESDRKAYKKDLAAWERGKKSGGPPPVEPEPPVCERFIVSDTTVEALAPLLQDNPGGLLLVRDELAAWLGAFNRYSSGSSDAPNYLSMFHGGAITVDRRSGDPRVIHVRQAHLAICGGIQPGILNRLLGEEHRESGLLARFLLTCPPRRPKHWTEAAIDRTVKAEVQLLIHQLFELKHDIDPKGRRRPVFLALSPAAKDVWTEFYNGHAQELSDLTGDLAAAWSKFEEYPARLALILQIARATQDSGLPCDQIDADSMAAAITIIEWCKAETKRVYAMLSESDQDRARRELAEWIERKGGAITARQLQQNYRPLKAPGAAEAALNRLMKAGVGEWSPLPSGRRGGRPSRVFRLYVDPPIYETAEVAEEKPDFVDVDSVDTGESTEADSASEAA
ncbi:MAG: DUF3987 domain-containing protein, partial [Planctomycetes bacterium]|nr:DUF3987 domain-containing protein [Planctomycetota bacterium]